MQKLFFSFILCLFATFSYASQPPEIDTLASSGNLPPDEFYCRVVINLGGISFTFNSTACEGIKSAGNLAHSTYKYLSEGLLSLFSLDDTSSVTQ